ncbi:hypothetical protein PPROV_000385200 [Pycnococcus provasolii]|uniref:Mog1p/PsbP-like protein n=1 Tax=Pycnococcus provasolii TaxID=41880 RepID=A0A830HH73_9CHLO|nr:hypothetical protein PPROV_000385200 [Pycnococcus provasolii]
MSPSTSRRPLYGGAMTVLHIPPDFLDTDEVIDIVKRPIPDNQEMFVAPGLGSQQLHQAPTTIFIDLLEVNEDTKTLHEDPAKLVAFHAGQLLFDGTRRENVASEFEAAAAEASTSATNVDVPGAVDKRSGSEVKAIGAYHSYLDVADLEIAVVRLPTVNTDVVISRSGVGANADADATISSLRDVAASLTVDDWNLFGEEA